ncbi:C3 and PZP-like, alpha-2-macroglobulin domain containing 8, variant 2 [Chamberlinius hualienensis]
MKSTVSAKLLFLIAVTINLPSIFANKKYMLTAPAEFESNSEENVCIVVGLKNNENVNVKVSLYNSQTVLATESKQLYDDESHCLKLKVKETPLTTATLLVEGAYHDGRSFKNQKDVRIRQKFNLILIQTDKAVYRVGQKVQIRIWHLTSSFRPIDDKLKTVTIEDPKRVTVHRSSSSNLKSNLGLYSLSYDLPDQSDLGNWKISVNDNENNVRNKLFTVNNIVHPPFVVKLDLPSVIPIKFSSFSYNICAFYHYNDSVVGNVQTKVTFTSTQVALRPEFVYNDKINGCINVQVTNQNFRFQATKFNDYNHLNYFVEVTDNETGKKITSTITKSLIAPHNIYWQSRPYYKLGFDYHGKIYVEDSNGKPAPNIKFKVWGYKNGITAKNFLENTYSTDEQGLFSIRVAKKHTKRTTTILLKIEPLDFLPQSYTYFGFDRANGIAVNDAIHVTLEVWSLSTNKSIKIEGKGKVLKCEQQTQFNIYVSKDAINKIAKAHYQIIAGNKITATSTLPIKIENINFYSIFKIKFKIDPIMSPKFDILVYIITVDGEIISDSETFTVRNCFENKVQIDFSQKKLKAGENAKTALSAAPNSFCSVLMTNESVQLSDSSDFRPYRIMKMARKNLPIPVNCTQISNNGNQVGNHVESSSAFDDLAIITLTNLPLEVSKCEEVKTTNSADEPIQFDYDLNHFFPETWLWQTVQTDNNGRASFQNNVPHSVDEWTGNAFCVSKNEGLGISPSTSISTYQHFELSATVPQTAVQGETVPVVITIKSFYPYCFPIALKLHDDQHFTLIKNNHQDTICVCKDKSNVHKYYIQAVKPGNVQVSVSLKSSTSSTICTSRAKPIQAQDFINKTLIITAPAIPKEKTESKWICATGTKNSVQMTLPTPLDADIKKPMKARATVQGDIMAPTILNMVHLIKLPNGCAEQTMSTLAPLVFAFEYLKTTGQMTKTIEREARRHVKSGYGREMIFRLPDGSFNTWGRAHERGSVWLTAFVIKTLASAQTIVYIDPKVIKKGIEFIISRQSSNGCFRYNTLFLNRHLGNKGGIGQGDPSEMALTLFVTIALLEASYDNNQVLSKAFNYIATDTKPTTLRQAMKAYATALAKKKTETETLIKQLEQKAITRGGMTYWTNGAGSTKEVNIEITSYVLLALATIHSDNVELSQRITAWLINQRQSNGGFSSTQDTVIGLQALEKYASRMAQKSKDLSVKIKRGNIEAVVNVFTRQTTNSIPIKGNEISVETNGKGCVLVQFTLSYYASGSHVTKTFYLDITVTASDTIPKSHNKKLHICTRYQAHGQQSNMAIIEVGLPTLYEANDQSTKVMRS